MTNIDAREYTRVSAGRSERVSRVTVERAAACIRLVVRLGQLQIFSPHWNPKSSLYRCVESKAVVYEGRGHTQRGRGERKKKLLGESGRDATDIFPPLATDGEAQSLRAAATHDSEGEAVRHCHRRRRRMHA